MIKHHKTMRILIQLRVLLICAAFIWPFFVLSVNAQSGSSVGVGVNAGSPQVALPSLGETGNLSLSDERRLGARIVRDLYAGGNVASDVLLAQYVDNIWHSLYTAAVDKGEVSPEMAQQLAWQVLLINDASVNAFALPGGYMGVNMGLIAMANDAHALASVLAHELSHVTQRHIARIMNMREQNAPWLMAAMVLGTLAVTQNSELANATLLGGQAVAAQRNLNFSRDMEREADRQGLQVQNLAGFDAAGFARMFEQLQHVNRLNDDGAFPYLRSHPLTSERVADMQVRLRDLPPPAAGLLRADWLAPSVQSFMRARARVLAQTRQDTWQAWVDVAHTAPTSDADAERQSWVARYQGALAAKQLQQHDQAWRGISALALSVQTSMDSKKNQPGDTTLQRVITNSALQMWVDMPTKPQDLNGKPIDQVVQASLQAMAQTALANKRGYRSDLLSAASVAGTASASASPGTSGDATFNSKATVAYAVSRDTQHMADQALRLWLVDHPADAHAWQVAAHVAQALGQPLRALRAQAESAAHTGQFEAAKDRFMAAQAMANRQAAVGNSDEQESAIVATRLSQVANALRQQQLDDKP